MKSQEEMDRERRYQEDLQYLNMINVVMPWEHEEFRLEQLRIEAEEKAQFEAERAARAEADRRYDESVRRRLAVNRKKPACRSRCHGTSCEFISGHRGLHVTTKDGGFGFWSTEHQDPPDAWDKIVDGFGL